MMNTAQKALVGASIVASVIAGGAFGAAITGGASAATDTPSDTSTTAPSDGSAAPNDRPDFDPSKGGHVGENGVAEELLTGDTADKVTAAVEAEYPDATIERVETDAEGAAYEAHIVQADGTHATVKLDESFAITATETERGGK
jgi:hypothetical protein